MGLWGAEAWALNGLRPIGVSAESNSLGGTGVCNFYNYYDALYKNPSLMALAPLSVGQSQSVTGLGFGQFRPQVKATYGVDQEYKRPIGRSSALFPGALGLGQKVTERLSLATGIYGGGGGANYGEKADSVYRAKSKTATYSLTTGVSWALSARTAVGMNGTISSVDTRTSNLSATRGIMVETGGRATSVGTLLGVSHRQDQFTIGAVFQPAQTALIEGARDIDEDGTRDNLLFTAVPLEAAAGLSWQDEWWMVAADYRFLQWSEAEFIKAVGWRDQHVLALGYELGKAHRLRLGLNVSNDAVPDRMGTDGFGTTVVSNRPLINLAADAFATTSGLGLTTRHYTIGSSHILSDKLRVNTAFQYMEPGSLLRTGAYEVPSGRRQYGWKSKFMATLLQLDLTYLW
jgi:long-chain fatty acid transport protein